jgi:glycerol-3-phosphate dehydrogenase
VIERAALLAQLRGREPWDVLIVGGGATGLGIAVDAAARGFRTALIEARDFASGTSSRSTKLVHGGVRYLAQGNVKLVREALAERALLLANAGGLVRPLEFIVPTYRSFEREVLRVGLGVYDALAGRRGVGATRWLTRNETINRLPGVRTAGLAGGVAYWDAQFDDARLAIALMRTAVRLGAIAVNYVAAQQMHLVQGRIDHVVAEDGETGERFELRAACVFNASGVWTDRVRALASSNCRPLITVSRGSHVVVARDFMPADVGLMIPKTIDGRVLFGIPWRGRLMLGTTDVPADGPHWSPRPAEAEVDFILDTARGYLQTPPTRADVLASFAGLRPLVAPHAPGATKTLSREHAIVFEHGNLVTVTGGKWTTYRRMALDALDCATRAGLLPARPCATATLKLDVDPQLETAQADAEVAAFSADVCAIASYMELVRRHEQARSIDDLLARRLRIALLDEALAARLKSLLLDAQAKKSRS